VWITERRFFHHDSYTNASSSSPQDTPPHRSSVPAQHTGMSFKVRQERDQVCLGRPKTVTCSELLLSLSTSAKSGHAIAQRAAVERCGFQSWSVAP